jgi:predicted ATPase
MTSPQIPFTNLKIQSFKSLQLVDIDLGVVNVFVGANGSGKSNLLEALGYLSAAASGVLDDQSLLRRGVRLGPPGSFSMRLREYPAPPETKIVATFTGSDGTTITHSAYRTPNPTENGMWADKEVFTDRDGSIRRKRVQIVDQPGGPISFGEPDQNSGDEIGATQFRSVATALSNYGIFAPTTPTLRGTIPDLTQRTPVGLAGGQLAVAVSDLLNKSRKKLGSLDLDDVLALLDWVEGIAVVKPTRDFVSPSVPTLSEIIGFTDRWMADGRNQISAYDASEGALYVLFALVLALHPKTPALFAVENLDQNMHPRLARATIRLFCNIMLKADPERQALLTTHNPLVLDGLDLRDDRIRLFTVDRNGQGATQIKRVQVDAKMLTAIEGGLSLSNLWIMGRLGGVPDLF